MRPESVPPPPVFIFKHMGGTNPSHRTQPLSIQRRIVGELREYRTGRDVGGRDRVGIGGKM